MDPPTLRLPLRRQQDPCTMVRSARCRHWLPLHRLHILRRLRHHPTSAQTQRIHGREGTTHRKTIWRSRWRVGPSQGAVGVLVGGEESASRGGAGAGWGRGL